MEFLGSLYAQQVDWFFYNHIPLSLIENHLKVTTAKPVASDTKILKYADMIMPLMFETWMELKPKQSKSLDGTVCSLVSHDNSIMLKIVMEIIMELHEMIDDTNQDAKLKFFKKYQEKFELHFVANFPYTQEDSSKKTPESGGAKCVYQNLSIAFLYIVFTLKHKQRFWKHRERIFSFVEDCVINWKIKDQEFNRLMKKLIRILFTKETCSTFSTESKQVFNQLIRKCNVDQSSYDPKLALVCEIIETSEVYKDSLQGDLVPQMVKVLSQREFVPIHVIRTVSTLAKQGNQVVFEQLEKTVIDIVKHLLGPMKISGSFNTDPLQWKREIANLIYWIKGEDVLHSIIGELKNDSISGYIRDIVDIKLNAQ